MNLKLALESIKAESEVGEVVGCGEKREKAGKGGGRFWPYLSFLGPNVRRPPPSSIVLPAV